MTFSSPSFEPVRLPSQGRSRAAVAAAVFATVGLIPVSVIFVIVAFQRVRRSTDRRMGFLLYALLMNLVALALIAWGLGRIAPDASGSENTPAALTLSVGQCYDQTAKKQDHGARKIIEASAPRSCAGPHDGEVGAVFDASGESWPGKAAITGCFTPHELEVVSTPRLPDGPWPGDDAVERKSVEGCRRAGMPKHDADGHPVELIYFHPTEQSWKLGDRLVVCLGRRVDHKKLTAFL
ncbi:hypothetical protein GCM10023195_57990 [Actinoallomurus liliacearum]|uniref:Septum formation-related domain-containing protein n=1 Tax=Actinoallomurus liliacearum TaxID=1080073 RepID=A0ABP8TS60_9ACTN